MNGDTSPRVVVVTGASGGIGRATAVELARRGHRVALGSRRIDAINTIASEIEATGGRAIAHPLDVGDPASVDAFFGAVEGALGAPDAVVNNAGVAKPADIADVDAVEMRRMLDTNLVGAILVTQRALPAMRAAQRGDVVFLASDSVLGPRPALVFYSATKAAVEHVARGMALELEGSGIRVSTLRVGPTLTGFADEWGVSGDEFMALVARWQTFGEQRHFNTCQPEDQARTIANIIDMPAGSWSPIVEVVPVPPTT